MFCGADGDVWCRSASPGARSGSPDNLDPYSRLEDSPYKSPTSSLSIDSDFGPDLPPPTLGLPPWAAFNDGEEAPALHVTTRSRAAKRGDTKVSCISRQELLSYQWEFTARPTDLPDLSIEREGEWEKVEPTNAYIAYRTIFTAKPIDMPDMTVGPRSSWSDEEEGEDEDEAGVDEGEEAGFSWLPLGALFPDDMESWAPPPRGMPDMTVGPREPWSDMEDEEEVGGDGTFEDE